MIVPRAIPWGQVNPRPETRNPKPETLCLVMIVHRSNPWGQAWAASYLWRPSDAPVVHSLETRYLANGDFDCFRHVEFTV